MTKIAGRERLKSGMSAVRAKVRSWTAPHDGPAPESELEARVAALEDAVEESRQLSQRLADVVDVVTEVLVPAVDRDDERLQEALARLTKTLGAASPGVERD
jgi:hypothetical protein